MWLLLPLWLPLLWLPVELRLAPPSLPWPCRRLLAYGDGLFEAVAAPRLHHQLAPDTL